MSLILPLRNALASSSRLPTATRAARLLSTSLRRSDIMSEMDKRINPREVIEKKRKEFEAKYGDKLTRRVEAEGVQDLDALKMKVMTPSVKQAIKAKQHVKEYKQQQRQEAEVASAEAQKVIDRKRDAKKQAQGDRAGVKPLGEIINLPLIYMTPHDSSAVSQIWNTYHTSHATLSSSFLSASLPASTYASMLSVAKENPFFVLPLPRPADSAAAATSGESVVTDSYEMFYLQWLFHPTSTASLPPSPDAEPKPLPLTSSVIFTPLEEFKKNGEWAQPQLVLTHYPEMSHSHDLVLMRGEISPAVAGAVAGSNENPGFVLSQQQAQLLALALQKFYCTGVDVLGEDDRARAERRKRADALVGFRERPQEWDWQGLVDMAYGGIV